MAEDARRKKPSSDPYGGATGGNPYEQAGGGGGGSVGGSIDWSSDPTTKQIDEGYVPVLGGNGDDPLGLKELFAKGSVGKITGAHKKALQAAEEERTLGARVQSVTDMNDAQKNALGEILVGAGVIKSDSKGFTISSLQTGLDEALKQASQSGSKSLSDYLVQQIEQVSSGGGLPGASAATQSPNTKAEIALELQNVATNYGLPMSPQSIQTWAQKYEGEGLDATAASDQFKQDYAVPTAQGLYPGFGGQLSTTVDTTTLLDPYAQIAQHTLGVDPKSINWQSPLWSNALNGGGSQRW